MHRLIALALVVVAAFVATAHAAGATAASAACEPARGLINAEVTRTIDLKSFIAHHTLTIVVRNAGTSPASRYHLALPTSLSAHLALITAEHANVEASCKATNGATLYPLALATPLAPGATTTLTVRMQFTHTMQPFPAEIKQAERQYVTYHDNVFFYSPYVSTSQTTTVTLASSKVEKYTEKPAKVARTGDTIVYGPYQDIGAWETSGASGCECG